MAIVSGILVGGMSRRMGRPKALLPVEGGTLLERTVHVAASVTPEVVLLGRPAFELPDSLRHLVVVDDVTPDCGPIGGLASFFEKVPASDCLLLACDMPVLSSQLLCRLIAASTDSVDAVVPREVGAKLIHPCCALYRSSAAPAVSASIAEGRYDLYGLISRLRWTSLVMNPSEALLLTNWNLPSDVGNAAGMMPNQTRSESATRNGVHS